MNMTSRFTLLAGVAGLAWAGCSAPAEEGEIPDPPTLPPPGIAQGQAGTTPAPVTAAGAGGAGGTATTPPVASGAGGTAMAAGGAGGAPVAAGGTGGAAIPTGTGALLTHDTTGWVAGTTNGVGIQGSFYPFGDADGTPPGDTSVSVGDLATPTSVCISGVASQVLGMPAEYSRYWGGGLGLNLGDPGGMVGPQPWSPGTVTGFSFTVTGPTIPPNVRVNFTTPTDTTYCIDDIPTAGATQVQLTAAVTDCFAPGTGTPYPSGTALEAIQWQVVTDVAASTPFDFCIENLTALTTP